MLLHIPVLDLNYASNYSHNMTVQASLYLWTRPVRIRRGYQIQEVQDAAHSAQSPQNPSKDWIGEQKTSTNGITEGFSLPGQRELIQPTEGIGRQYEQVFP